MVDIQRMRELLASFPETFNKAHSMGGPTDWSARASLEYHYSEAMASLPALLDELERLRAELAFRDAPDEPLSAGEIDSIVKRVLAEESK